MSTTQLFAELLVIGLGVVIWLLFLAATVFEFSWQDIASNTNLLTLAPIGGIAYVLGIVFDRIGYSLFRGLEEGIQKTVIEPGVSPSVDDRERYLSTSSEDLKAQIAYNRSRLRICRSWMTNFLLIGIASAIWGYTSKQNAPAFLLFLCLLLGLTTFFVWYKLVEDHYKNIKSSYNFLAKSKMISDNE